MTWNMLGRMTSSSLGRASSWTLRLHCTQHSFPVSMSKRRVIVRNLSHPFPHYVAIFRLYSRTTPREHHICWLDLGCLGLLLRNSGRHSSLRRIHWPFSPALCNSIFYNEGAKNANIEVEMKASLAMTEP
jgi:hypothetical protein